MKKQIFAGVLATAMAVTCAATVSAIEAKDAITGDITATTFFNPAECSDAVELKDGDSYTISFTNKSKGTNFYENFILVVDGAGALESTFSGNDDPAQALVIRSDNFGWGGALSDFGTGKVLNELPGVVEGSHVCDINWDNWVAAMTAGAAVEINISRDGDTLAYSAKIGEYNNAVTLKSGKALPESLYVFLSGENVTLSGIKTVKNNASAAEEPADTTAAEEPAATTTTAAANDEPAATTTTAAAAAGNTNATTPNKGTPDTGVEGVAVVAGLAIVAAGAIVVAKKRK